MYFLNNHIQTDLNKNSKTCSS